MQGMIGLARLALSRIYQVNRRGTLRSISCSSLSWTCDCHLVKKIFPHDAAQYASQEALCYHLIEDMVVSLRMQLMRHSRLLQQVSLDEGTTDVLTLAEVDLNQLAKATAIVVAQGSGVAEGL